MSKELDEYRRQMRERIVDIDGSDNESWAAEAKKQFFKYLNKQDIDVLTMRHKAELSHDEYMACAVHFIEGYLAGRAGAAGLGDNKPELLRWI